MINRVLLMVLDSVGCGYLPDAYLYKDEGANTLAHIIEKYPNINLPNLKELGLYNIIYNKNEPVKASYGKLKEISVGKDTLTGHYELMGLLVNEPFKTFTDTGFPKELIDLIEEKCGYKVIGNKSASGTEIIKELGEEHIKTKAMIIYTSSDSVLQIACHEKYFGLEELYRVSKIVREICLDPKYKVARIIARPFIGENKNEFKRTPNRHDYALEPFDKLALDFLKESKIPIFAYGKINDIYCGRGIEKAFKTKSNKDGLEIFINNIKKEIRPSMHFINLVDFDMLYGHRRDVLGYKNSLEELDSYIPYILDNMTVEDLLIITADHGNDPTWSGTDHTREYVPLICYRKNGLNNNLNIRETFADIGYTICDIFNTKSYPKIGKSFINKI